MGNNTIKYYILDKQDKIVGIHSQNIMCVKNNDGLEKFQPSEDFKIIAYMEDDYENGDEWENKPISLKEWLSKNPAGNTFKKFDIGDKVSFRNKILKGEGVIKAVFKGKWFPEYSVQLENNTSILIQQTDIIPEKLI